MALYAMSDLHLSFSCDKPMDVFGAGWQNYTERIFENWTGTVKDNDLVIVGGDISWAMYLEDTYEDFQFLNSLPGKKLLLRGNHDYWWMSIAKMKAFFEGNGFDTVSFLQNDAVCFGDSLIAGTRGWLLPSNDGFGSTDRKIYERELIRLELALEAMAKLEEKSEVKAKRRIAVFHYPPFDKDNIPDSRITELLSRYSVTDCLYGHLHGLACKGAFNGKYGGINFALTSADFLEFRPLNLDF